MTEVLEVKRVLKRTSAVVRAWVDGQVRLVYFNSKIMSGSPAKYFERFRDAKGVRRVRVVSGKLWQDADCKPYFVPRQRKSV